MKLIIVPITCANNAKMISAAQQIFDEPVEDVLVYLRSREKLWYEFM